EVVFSRNDEGIVTEILGSAFDVTARKMLEDELKKYSGHLEELVEIRTSEIKSANIKLKEEINERAKAERNIIDAEEKFRSLVENALVGIYIIQDEKFAYVNPRYEDIFGYGSGEMTGMNAWNVVWEEDKVIIRENMRKRIENEVNSIQYSFRAKRKNGSLIDVEIKGTSMIYDGKPSIIGTLQDITESLKAEELLKEQKEFLRTVIDTDPNFVFAKDWDGRFTLVNKAVADNYSSTAEELIGKTDSDFNPNIAEVEHFLADDREVIASGKVKFIPEEEVTNSGTGQTKWYQTIKVPLKAANGSTHVLGVAADITARKLAESITIKSLREKELLLKEIHHRVKNNLQIIISLLKLQSKYVYDPRDLEIFNKSRSRVETMSLIHEKLYKSKDISQIDIGNYLKDLVSHLLNAYKVNSSIIEFNISAENILMTIDTAIPCGLIVNELINNILKHAFPDGYKGKIELNLRRSDENVVLEVTDNGIGIPTEFDMDKSDSLGMRLIDTLVKQLDGIIEVNSLNGSNGTKVVIEFKEIKYKERI
ncbi:MAG: PAS domain S-box protein, partial [Ignavibacteria bacterium]